MSKTNRELLELEVRLERRRSVVAEDYAKCLVPIIKEFGTYCGRKTYRLRTTLKERLRFCYKRSDFLIGELPFSGKWFKEDNLMIGARRHYDQKEWGSASLTDYCVYEDCKEVLRIKQVIFLPRGFVVWKMRYLGHLTSDLIQRLLKLSSQATQEARKQREPEKQKLEQELKRLVNVDIGLQILT